MIWDQPTLVLRDFPVMTGEVMCKNLECGDFHRGFARLSCGGCCYQTILAYSSKCKLFCPSCQQKRDPLFAGWLDGQTLHPIGHAQLVLTIPKLVRPIFKYHPKDPGLLRYCLGGDQPLNDEVSPQRGC